MTKATFHVREGERTALYFDGPNFYASAKALGLNIDYRKLRAYFEDNCNLIRANYYTALHEGDEHDPIRPLVDWLSYNGYMLVSKPVKVFDDSEGRRRQKGNMDIDIAVDMLVAAKHLEHIILFSGDGDFRRLIEQLQAEGLRVTVVSTMRSQPPMCADELRRQADNYVDLESVAELIAKPAEPTTARYSAAP